MAKPSEEISKYNANANGKPDANTANDALNLGGIPAEEYATQDYVKRYHDNKETALKEYIDQQDARNLQESKAYAETIVNRQDFSGFAKVTDIQTLNQNLTQKIEQCGTNCANNLNTKITQVVSDTNANFDDVNTAITSLNRTTNSLFTSVSNGKAKVAAAITDKGVATASDATYDTMASNIKKIKSSSGGGDYDENFVNTSDGTATDADIVLGKTAYVKGRKIYGTHTELNTYDATATASDILEGATAYIDGEKVTGTYRPLDTSDATATAEDILLGETAYVNGQKVTGTLEQIIYPTYGTDTANATATPSDIALGKTAYARGSLLIGTGNFSENPAVEEVYGTSANNYESQEYSIINTKDPDTENKIASRECIAFSKDNNYCVSVVRLSSTANQKDYYIESRQVTSEGLIINASAGENNETIYKKYRYTKSDLGLTENEVVRRIVIGAAGFLGYSTRCLLLIETYDYTDTSKKYWHFYGYHLNDNGVIGKEYNNERFALSNYVVSPDNYYQGLVFANTDPYTIFTTRQTSRTGSSVLYFKKITINVEAYSDSVNLSIVYGGEVTLYSDSSTNYASTIDKLYPSIDDTYLLGATTNTSCIRPIYLTLDSNLNLKNSYVQSGSLITVQDISYIPDAGEFIGTYNSGRLRVLNSLWNATKTLKIKDWYDNSPSTIMINTSFVSSDSKRFFTLLSKRSGSNYYLSNIHLLIFNVDDILNAADGDTIEAIQDIKLFTNTSEFFSDTTAKQVYMQQNPSSSVIHVFTNTDKRYTSAGAVSSSYNDACLATIRVDEDSQNLIGVRYKNQFFRSIKSELLSATTGDVASGKTFIGYDGSVQTGTLVTI